MPLRISGRFEKKSIGTWVSEIAPQLSFMRMNWPVSVEVMLPVAGRLPPVSVVWVPLVVETLSNAIGQPGCSTPSGGMPSLVTG